MKTGDNVLFYYKNRAYSGEITSINLQIQNTIVYNVRCGVSNEFEIWKNKLTGEIVDIKKL